LKAISAMVEMMSEILAETALISDVMPLQRDILGTGGKLAGLLRVVGSIPYAIFIRTVI
jgi:hypothetical protein